jgi:hypothetical protein
MNAVAIEGAPSNLACQPFDAAEFLFAFLAAFGNKDPALKHLRTGNNASDVPGGMLQRYNLHIAVRETGACALPDFPNPFGFVLPLAGISTIKERAIRGKKT